jgi:nucleoside-diphosphate-sugar epimerase
VSSFTVLGAGGFIGSELVASFRSRNVAHFAPGRGDDLRGRDLGHVIYCIGLTADFRRRPLDTVEAHVSELLRILRDTRFDSLLYLSSTRLYAGCSSPATESARLSFSTADPSDLYNLSKAMGESLGLSSGKRFRVARLSNVYGRDFSSQNFLAMVLREAVQNRRVVLETSLDSEKDYVSVEDVVDWLPAIAEHGRHDVYNLAAGRNVSNRSLLMHVKELTGCSVDTRPGAPTFVFPQISIDRLREEFGANPRSVLSDLQTLVESHGRTSGT